ncbi:MAG: hypothetical protein GXX96_39750 [Planctomycetaceae bacterium]|nr:hypothetical protein [Planctomycetaceae bacterium]
MSIERALSKARATLDHAPVQAGVDPRWQALIDVGEHMDSSPDEIWEFIEDTRRDADEDLEAALTTVLLEHLVEQHAHIRSKVIALAETDPQIKRMLQGCW